MVPRRILRLPKVIDKTGLPRASIYLKISQGSFPHPIPLGTRAVGWIESDIEQWIAEQIERNQKIRGVK